MTSTIASNSVWITSLIDSSHEVVGVERDRGTPSRPGSAPSSAPSSCARPSDTSRPLAPGCWYTAMMVAGVPFIWLSTMYCWRPISARATSPTRTMALPSWLARRMMFSYCLGSVNCGCVMTGNVSSTGPALGCCPICPAPNSWFCWLIALAMSRRRDAERGHAVRVHPDPHRLVGHAHDLRLARAVDALQRVEHVDVGVVGDVVRAVAVVLRVHRRPAS